MRTTEAVELGIGLQTQEDNTAVGLYSCIWKVAFTITETFLNEKLNFLCAKLKA